MSHWINFNIKRSWTTGQQTNESKEKIQELSLAKECYSFKLDLLTNATVVDDAIRFVNRCSISKENKNDKESKEQHEYDGNNINKKSDDGKQKQEERSRIIITSTHNQLF